MQRIIRPRRNRPARRQLLTGGTERRTALEISDELQMLGAQLSTGANLDLSTVYRFVSEGHA